MHNTSKERLQLVSLFTVFIAALAVHSNNFFGEKLLNNPEYENLFFFISIGIFNILFTYALGQTFGDRRRTQTSGVEKYDFRSYYSVLLRSKWFIAYMLVSIFWLYRVTFDVFGFIFYLKSIFSFILTLFFLSLFYWFIRNNQNVYIFRAFGLKFNYAVLITTMLVLSATFYELSVIAKWFLIYNPFLGLWFSWV